MGLVYLGGWSQDGIVGIVTSYRLDGLGFKSQQKQVIFSSPKPSRAAVGPTQPHIQLVLVSFHRGNSPGP